MTDSENGNKIYYSFECERKIITKNWWYLKHDTCHEKAGKQHEAYILIILIFENIQYDLDTCQIHLPTINEKYIWYENIMPLTERN